MEATVHVPVMFNILLNDVGIVMDWVVKMGLINCDIVTCIGNCMWENASLQCCLHLHCAIVYANNLYY